MTKKPKHDDHGPDENERAARVLKQTMGRDDPLPRELEAAWAAWISRIQGIDERTRTLLRAAFEAGHAARS